MSDENRMNPKDDVRLNIFALDEEVQRQSGLYFHYSQMAADAKADRDKAVLRLDTRTAEVELNIRANPPGGKITEAGVKAHLDADPELKELREKVIETNHDMALLEGICRALDHKKSQLDNAVRLWSSGYYQDPGRNAASDAASGNMREQLNTTRRNGNKE